MTKPFKDMDRDKQAEIVRKGMEAGGSYKSLAARYGVGVGKIAGICRDYHISSTHKAPSMGKGKEPPPQAEAPKPIPPKPAPKPKAPVPKPQAVFRAPPGTPGLEEARSEASRCESTKVHCPYEAKVGTRFCPLHQDEETARR